MTLEKIFNTRRMQISTLRIVSAIIITLTISFSIVIADDNRITDDISSDSLLSRRDAIKHRSTSEEIAYFPGRLLFLPPKYFLKGVGKTAAYIDDQKIIQKVDDFLNSDDGRRGAQPVYSARKGAGMSFYQNGLFYTPSTMNHLFVEAALWEQQKQYYFASLDNVFIIRNDFPLKFSVKYHKLPEERFFGLGSDAKLTDETDYTIEQSEIAVNVSSDISADIALHGTLSFGTNSITAGMEKELPNTVDVFPADSVAGVGTEAAFVIFGGCVSSSELNRPGNPTQGYELSLASSVKLQTDGDEYSDWKISVDGTRYVHLFFNRLFAFRAMCEIHRPIGSTEVPFYYMSEIGREETIRGFERGRFIDNDMVMLSAEYRYPIWNNWNESGFDFFLFADAGQVAGNLFTDFSPSDFSEGVGFGIRAWTLEGLAARLAAGKSDDGWRIYLGVN